MIRVTRNTPLDDLPMLMSVAELRCWLNLSRSKIYELISSGEISSIRFGRSIKIPRDCLKSLIEAGEDGRPGSGHN